MGQELGIARADLEGDVVTAFRRVAQLQAHKVALSWTRNISYGELDRMSDSLAVSLLEELGEGPEAVPFLLEHGVRPIISLLGILKAGKSYVALRPDSATAQRAAVLEQLEAKLLIVEKEEAFPRLKTLKFQDCLHKTPSESLPKPSCDTLAATVFTSGSTGSPKAFGRSHKALLHRAYLYQQEHQLCPEDRQGLTAACHFVASETDIFGALLSGATLCPYPLPQLHLAHFQSWLEEEEISLLHPPVGFFRRFLGSLPERPHFPKLRLVALGGEAIYRADIRRWKARTHRGCQLCHRYSSSEAGNIASLTLDHSSELPWQQIPAGLICPDKAVRIESSNGELLKAGEIGEVVVESHFLSTGFRKVCRTGDLGSFDERGLLLHHGRRDRLAKVRGYRVSLSEVEASLLENPNITEASVQLEEERLVAYLVTDSLDEESLRENLRTRLQPEAVPSQFFLKSSLALNHNGKVAAEQSSSGPLPESLEQKISEIWSRVLKTHVKEEDNFFKLGGTSLAAAEIVLQLETHLGWRVHASWLTECPTPRVLADKLLGREALGNLLAVKAKGERPPLFLVHPNSGQTLPFYRLAERLSPEQPLYCFRASGLGQGEKPHTNLFDMAQCYVEQLQSVQAQGPYRLGGRCLGAIVALEMARILQSQGQQIQSLIILDAAPPNLRRTVFHTLARQAKEVVLWLLQHAKNPGHVLRRIYDRLTMSRRWKCDEVDSQPEMRGLEIYNHLGHLLFQHESEPYLGDAIVFRGSSAESRVWVQEWARVIEGHLQIVDIPGEHRQLLREPFVRETAEKLNHLL